MPNTPDQPQWVIALIDNDHTTGMKFYNSQTRWWGPLANATVFEDDDRDDWCLNPGCDVCALVLPEGGEWIALDDAARREGLNVWRNQPDPEDAPIPDVGTTWVIIDRDAAHARRSGTAFFWCAGMDGSSGFWTEDLVQASLITDTNEWVRDHTFPVAGRWLRYSVARDLTMDLAEHEAFREAIVDPATITTATEPSGPAGFDVARAFDVPSTLVADQPDRPDPSDEVVTSVTATDEQVLRILLAGRAGHSEWRLFRMASGDLLLGTYPTGDTYHDINDDGIGI